MHLNLFNFLNTGPPITRNIIIFIGSQRDYKLINKKNLMNIDDYLLKL